MRVKCNLREIMRERGMKVAELRQMTGLGSSAAATLRAPTVKRIDLRIAGKVCDALDITMDQLFTLCPDDIWAAVKESRELTVHCGSRPVTGVSPRCDDPDRLAQMVGAWDLRAYAEIVQFLNRQRTGVSVALEEHPTGPSHGLDPSLERTVERVFQSGNHLILGSQIATGLAEAVVCRAQKVSPFTPSMRTEFAYAFDWDSDIPSSFGRRAPGSDFGIVSTDTGELVARQTAVRVGEGDDCALILTYRIRNAPVQRLKRGANERVIIVFLGHTGVGTLAAARVAMKSGAAAALYPSAPETALMGIVAAKYYRYPSETPVDNRVAGDCWLVRPANPGMPHPGQGSDGGAPKGQAVRKPAADNGQRQGGRATAGTIRPGQAKASRR